tara:strand:- start:148 stop:411 length:264 start_codon:yes stop_codon:yes gene_type:complete
VPHKHQLFSASLIFTCRLPELQGLPRQTQEYIKNVKNGISKTGEQTDLFRCGGVCLTRDVSQSWPYFSQTGEVAWRYQAGTKTLRGE